jgi:ABC-type branched-subunit amino acid transport system substrate-binding protein
MAGRLGRWAVSRRAVVGWAVLGAAGLLAGCLPPKRRAPEVLLAGLQVKLGVVFPLTGRWTDFARKNLVALEMAVEEINDSGGIGGVQVSTIVKDDGSDPTRAAELVRELATGDRVLAILGPFSSSEAEVAFPMANEVQVPTIAQASSKPGVGQANRPWAFRRWRFRSGWSTTGSRRRSWSTTSSMPCRRTWAATSSRKRPRRTASPW